MREALGIGFGGGTYSHLFYVADADATGPAVDRDIHVDLDQSDLLAIFPMTGKNRVRLVGTIPDDAVGDESAFGFADVSRRPIEQMKLDTRHYAKRQWTWWRAQPNTHWLSGFGFEENVIAEASQMVEQLLMAKPNEISER